MAARLLREYLYSTFLIMLFSVVFSNKIIIIVLVGLITITSATATNWYIDNVGSNGNGQSWGSAWNSFSNIVWDSVNPGDTIYISGGSTSKIYNEQLRISKSGTVGNLITITKGIDNAHNGMVIITGGGYLYGKSYTKISNLKFIDKGILSAYTHFNYLDNLIVENAGISAGGSGVWTERYDVDNLFITNSIILSPTNSGKQTDGIYLQNVENAFIFNNTIIIRNVDWGGHNDPIQLVTTKNVYIGGNYLKVDAPGLTVGQVFIEENQFAGGTYIYNNLVDAPNIQSPQAFLSKAHPSGSTAKTYLYGNTIIYGGTSPVLLIQNPEFYVKNNIFYKNSKDRIVVIQTDQTNQAEWNNNIYYNTNGGSVVNDFTLAQWQSQGYDLLSQQTNPLFKDFNGRDFSLKSTSPAIDAGVNIGTPYNVDINGDSRGSVWDIGAYEYGGSSNFHPADLNRDGCIDLNEISAYVQLWLNGGVSLGDVSSAVNIWLQSC